MDHHSKLPARCLCFRTPLWCVGTEEARTSAEEGRENPGVRTAEAKGKAAAEDEEKAPVPPRRMMVWEHPAAAAATCSSGVLLVAAVSGLPPEVPGS